MLWLKSYFVSLTSFILVLSVKGDISPDSKKIYHDITAGRGLYSHFEQVISLNATTFKSTIFNSSQSTSWLVEFYNSWCGHCHRFSPVWKQFSLDISGWKDVISVAAVDCSNPVNTPLCREYEVMFYPMVKYFPPLPANDFLGSLVKSGDVESLIKTTVKTLREDAADGLVNQPSLLPFKENALEKVWQHVPVPVQFSVIVVQQNDSVLGESLALDFLKVPSVKVLIVFDNNVELIKRLGTLEFPFIYILDRHLAVVPIKPINQSHITVYSQIRDILMQKGVEIPEIVRKEIPPEGIVDVAQIMKLMEIEEQIKKKLNHNDLSDIVFQVDIENALRNSLRVEIPSHKNIAGESFDALKLYLEALIEFFPFGKKGIDYLHSIMFFIKDRNSVTGTEFGNLVVAKEITHSPYISPGSNYIGCRGSHPKFRGYPCGLWTLFHTLTVQADYARTTENKKVLRAMLGYIKNFFGCSECSMHFQSMAVTFEGNVSSTADSILWLWKAHNNVNKRLSKDPTEDPKHPKLQFPPPKFCRACHYSNGTWNEQIVLAYLRSMYKNISYFMLDELPESSSEAPIASNLLRHENVEEEKGFNYSSTESKTLQFSFNILDVSLCVILYMFSLAIIILVCIKFLFKKTYRKKAYAYDIFQKV